MFWGNVGAYNCTACMKKSVGPKMWSTTKMTIREMLREEKVVETR